MRTRRTTCLSLEPLEDRVLLACPCTIWDSTATPQRIEETDTNAVEVGVKFRSDVGGFITGIRFYKGSTNTGTHIGNLWTRTGALLASVTFAGETGSGWKQTNFASPVAITANTTYVASYHTSVGRYALTEPYFAAAGVDNPPLHALADGVDGGNGVYQYGASGFPTQSFNASNYWVDVVFTTTSTDTTPPTVTSVSPASGATGVGAATNVTVTFSEAMDPATINTNTFQLKDAANALVSATVTYDTATRTATLDPTGSLADSMTYTAIVAGGASDPRVKDTAGNALAANHTWSFTTVAASDTGPGGPILIVAKASNPFSRYYSETLRAEGINAFTIADISAVSATTLNAYEVVILGEMPLTPGQVSMFSDWVKVGGNLIAMRPDKQLAGLLGLTAASSTLSNAYLLVNTSSGPGLGITDQTIQFHGTADAYTLNGATSVATLYATAGTATLHPAVTLHSVGTGGGQAAAFTYDLARSVVYTRQGNPAWAGQDRDGVAPIAPNDLFFGAAAGDPKPDWVDLNKVAIPQADEQQRLLANLIHHMNLDKKPLPRFWYFPHGKKAVVVMTGDDHGNGGTAGRFDQYKSFDTAGCSVSDWQCIRSTSYIYPVHPLTNKQAAAYTADGFEIALHVNTGCANWTPTSLQSFYTDQLQQLRTAYPSLPAPATVRTHCAAWSDYDTQPQVEHSHGIRLDTNYYYWPSKWILNRPGMFTGSGLIMRFATQQGTIMDVYQAATQMTDESGQSYPFTSDTLLDRALGPEGYYGAFVANAHTDLVNSTVSDAIINSARTRNVPIVSARQMLSFLDGRNSSSFGLLAWNAIKLTLSFTLTVGSGATGLQAMVPARSANSTLTRITRDGTPVAYTTQSIKGVHYAFLPAVAGSYVAQYETDATPTCPCSIWSNSATPQRIEATDSNAIEVGVKFRSDVEGFISGIRFYKGSTNTGTHVGNLWTKTGTLLASVTFNNETASGWQQARFASPVAISAHTTYVASYHTSLGRYAVTEPYFTTAVDNLPLHALADGVDGANGVYKYGASGFPTQTWNASNYWVDVVFTNALLSIERLPDIASTDQPSYPGATTDAPIVPAVTSADLQPLVAEAIAKWSASDMDDAQVERLRAVEVKITDLPGPHLGLANAQAVLIDPDAAGYGWFIDKTPSSSEEFIEPVGEGDWRARPGSPAVGRVDLLTVLAHELGHVLGLQHAGAHEHPYDVMAAALEPGVRRVPYVNTAVVDDGAAILASAADLDQSGWTAGSGPSDADPIGIIQSIVFPVEPYAEIPLVGDASRNRLIEGAATHRSVDFVVQRDRTFALAEYEATDRVLDEILWDEAWADVDTLLADVLNKRLSSLRAIDEVELEQDLFEIL